MAFDLDSAVRPVDDLFRHVNGRWLSANEIPADKASWGSFMMLRDQAQEAVRDIITGMDAQGADASPSAQKIADLYASFMDADAIEERGLAGLPFDQVDAIASTDDLLAWLGFALRSGFTSLIGADVDADPGDPKRYLLYVGQDGIGLPDEEYYRLPQHAETLAAYETFVGRMLAAGGYSADAASRVVDLERRVAALHWDKVRCRDIEAMYNLTPVSDLGATWRTILAGAGVGVGEVVVAQPSFLTDVVGLLEEVPLADWRDWARFHVLAGRASVLPATIYDLQFDFYSRTLNGVPEQLPRWKRGVALVERFLGEAVGEVYVERHFSPVAKHRMDDLVARLIDAYRESITDLDWMTEATRVEALAKLDAFTPKIGYPERWRDYSGLTIERGDLLGNVQRGAEFSFDDELAKASEQVRPWEWLMTPQTVNAYYHPFRNEIVFPAAILQPPFFDVDADDAVNFGAIGAVIGHEIGHGFDDQGSTCDGEGRLRDWWTPADKEAFAERTKRLVTQYDGLVPAQLTEGHVNGELTLGENIGDLGGLGIAFRAWELAGGADAEPIEGLTGAQRLFLSWARAWESKDRDEALRERMSTDPHSPAEFRCNQVVKNIDAFHAAFGTQPGDGLWMDPEERVRIW